LSAPGHLAGKVALVTGGTRGIGDAVSRALIGEGAGVHALYRSDGQAAGRLADALGERFSSEACDVSDAEAAAKSVARLLEERSRIDILVNCAGGSADRLLLRATPAYVRDTIGLNLIAVIHMTRLVLPSMLKHRFGRVITLSSAVAAMGNPGQSVYAAAKAGVEGFSRSVAREVAAKGVTVNCVAPGWIDTDLTAAADTATRERVIAATPVGRAGKAEEVAHAVSYLASERAAFVTGIVLQVGGGLYM
jgi:3-oxoacyl-[acyl-carrier protein] reductase